MRIIKQAPESVVESGHFCFGCYNQPIKHVNLLDAKTGGLKLFKNFKLREWQEYQLYSEEGWFVMIALYNTKKVCIVQFILYNVHTGEKLHYEKKVLPRSLKIPNGLIDTEARHISKGFDFSIHHNISKAQLALNVNLKGRKGLPNLSAEFKGFHNCDLYTPCVVCLPFTSKKGMYSHKCLMPLEGRIEVGTQEIVFSKESSSLILDDHKGYYPYNTKYDWATAVGFDAEGRRYGFNLTDNQVQNQEDFNENCFWLDGEMIPLPPVKFSRPNGVNQNWIIKDKNGKVDLLFSPEMNNSVQLNLILLSSNYHGPYGKFNGHVKSEDGRLFNLKNTFGMGEKFFLRS